MEARWFFQQLMLAVDFCHRMGVVNRDIKLENTLLAGDGRPLIKIADFGFSKDEHGQSAPTTRVGTVMCVKIPIFLVFLSIFLAISLVIYTFLRVFCRYMAPEVVSNGPDNVYDAKLADVWSCGVVLYAMLSGQYPFKRSEDNAMGKVQAVRAALQRILKGEFMPPQGVSPLCLDLLQGMINPGT